MTKVPTLQLTLLLLLPKLESKNNFYPARVLTSSCKCPFYLLNQISVTSVVKNAFRLFPPNVR
jgi:hypothetical protein